MLKIDLSKHASKFLKKVPTKKAKQLAKKLTELRENPAPQDAKKIINTSYLRTDMGEYRIIYFVEKHILHIVLIGKRNDSEVYKKLERM